MLLLFLLLGAATVDDLSRHPWKLLFAGLALAFSYVSATSVNDIADRKIDSINHPGSPGRPLIRGDAAVREVWTVFILASMLSIAFAGLIGLAAVILLSISLLINVSYSLPPLRLSYRTFLAPIILGIAYVGIPYLLGLVIIGGLYIPGKSWWWIAGLYLMFVGRIILKDFRDRKGDAKYKKPTFLLRFGKDITCTISLIGIISGGLIITFLVRDKLWLSAIVLVYLAAIIGMLFRLRISQPGYSEQLSIGVGAKMGNGLLITLLGVYSLQDSGASQDAQLLFAAAIAFLYLLSYVNFLRSPQKAVLGYKG